MKYNRHLQKIIPNGPLNWHTNSYKLLYKTFVYNTSNTQLSCLIIKGAKITRNFATRSSC